MPHPQPQKRHLMRKALVTINVDTDLMTQMGAGSMDDAEKKVVLFILCVFALAAIVVALALTLRLDRLHGQFSLTFLSKLPWHSPRLLVGSEQSTA